MSERGERFYPDFVSKCENCAALCCVAFPFEKSEAFAENKDADRPCRHLSDKQKCGIHASRSELNYSGCIQFDCYGAGPRVLQDIFELELADRVAAHTSDVLEAFRQLTKIHTALAQLMILDQLSLSPDQNEQFLALYNKLEPQGGWTIDSLLSCKTSKLEAEVHAFAQSLIGTPAGDGLLAKRSSSGISARHLT